MTKIVRSIDHSLANSDIDKPSQGLRLRDVGLLKLDLHANWHFGLFHQACGLGSRGRIYRL